MQLRCRTRLSVCGCGLLGRPAHARQWLGRRGGPSAHGFDARLRFCTPAPRCTRMQPRVSGGHPAAAAQAVGACERLCLPAPCHAASSDGTPTQRLAGPGVGLRPVSRRQRIAGLRRRRCRCGAAPKAHGCAARCGIRAVCASQQAHAAQVLWLRPSRGGTPRSRRPGVDRCMDLPHAAAAIIHHRISSAQPTAHSEAEASTPAPNTVSPGLGFKLAAPPWLNIEYSPGVGGGGAPLDPQASLPQSPQSPQTPITRPPVVYQSPQGSPRSPTSPTPLLPTSPGHGSTASPTPTSRNFSRPW